MDLMQSANMARREWIDQPKCFLSEHLNGHWKLRTEWRIARSLHLPSLPQRQPHQVWGVSVVRDEADIIEFSVHHLLSQGIDHVLVADHLSQDSTGAKLVEMARHDPRIHVVRDREPGHFQKEKVSHLARVAWLCGAGWVVPFDADEFWFAPGESLADHLAGRDATVCSGRMVDLLPLGAGAVDLTTEFMLDRTGAGPRKVAFRAHPLALVGPGNHGVARVGSDEPGLIVAHVPYRSPNQMRRKFTAGASALRAAGASAAEGWHWVAGERYTEDQAAARWEAMRRGEAIAEIGWRGVDISQTERVLQWANWPLGDALRAD